MLILKARGHINIKVDFTAKYITKEKTFHIEKKGQFHQEEINLTLMHLIIEPPNIKSKN